MSKDLKFCPFCMKQAATIYGNRWSCWSCGREWPDDPDKPLNTPPTVPPVGAK